ncbi:general stress protein [Cohnella endophytica]|nr:general stress protein [Cohnella endophytica]
MAMKIGIFDKEENVLDAIRLLREAGAEEEDIRVIVNNREGAPQLSSQDDIRMEELYEIQQARSREADGDRSVIVTPSVVGYPVGTSPLGSGGLVGVVVNGDSVYDGPDSSDVLRDMGIPRNAAERCARAIEKGRYVLVADTESDIRAESLLDHAGAGEVVT